MGWEFNEYKTEQISENLKSQQTANFEKAFQNDSSFEKEKVIHINTLNEKMEGQSISGIRFAKRTFMLDGEKIEGVFPIFNSKFDTKLPENLYKASDNEQMKYCTKKLAEKIERDAKFAKEFRPRQLEQIKNGEPRISGLTWHHNEICGKMQLVDANDHSAARHTGGRSIWGGGSESR